MVFSAVVLKDTDIFAINVGFLGGGGGKYISKGVGKVPRGLNPPNHPGPIFHVKT